MNNYIFIPGFLDTAKYRKIEPGLEIWLRNIKQDEPLSAEYLIGHSLGANFALLHWQKYQGKKLILINPLIKKRKMSEWAYRWIRYLLFSENVFSWGRADTLLYLPSAFRKCFELLKPDFERLLTKIPKDDIIIIRGKKDKYLCDNEVAEFIKQQDIKIIEVSEAGHEIDNFKDILDKIINFGFGLALEN